MLTLRKEPETASSQTDAAFIPTAAEPNAGVQSQSFTKRAWTRRVLALTTLIALLVAAFVADRVFGPADLKLPWLDPARAYLNRKLDGLMPAAASRTTFEFAPAVRGSLSVEVNATGSLRPVSIVRVSTQQGGVVEEIFVDFTSEVKKGQMLARFDSATQKLEAARIKTEMEIAELDLRLHEVRHGLRATDPETLKKITLARDAEVKAVREQLEIARANSERVRALTEKGAAPARALEEAESRVSATIQQVETVKANAVRSEADMRAAISVLEQSEIEHAMKQKAVEQARQRYQKAGIEVERGVIHSPVDGTVVWKAVEVGQTISVATDPPTLFYIAQDLTEMQVEATVDEADIAKVHVGQRATYTVSGFPGRVFEGVVRQIRTGSDALYGNKGNASAAVGYIVVISALNKKRELFPGMTASVRIQSQLVSEQWLVPNQALRISERMASEHKMGPPPAPGLVPLFLFTAEKKMTMSWVRPGPTDGTHTAVGQKHPHIGEGIQYVIARRSVSDARP